MSASRTTWQPRNRAEAIGGRNPTEAIGGREQKKIKPEVIPAFYFYSKDHVYRHLRQGYYALKNIDLSQELL